MGKISIELWKKYYNPRKQVHRDILTVLLGNEHCDSIIEDSHDFALPEDEADDLEKLRTAKAGPDQSRPAVSNSGLGRLCC